MQAGAGGRRFQPPILFFAGPSSLHGHHAQFYGIGSLEEARAYLADPILGKRLHECVGALLELRTTDAAEVLGTVDALKLCSCLTLFRVAAPHESAFARALEQYFEGRMDPKTIELLSGGG